MDKINSSLCNIKYIIDNDMVFNIPRYQRLYVWETQQVDTLFNDLHSAAFMGKDMYYLGGVVIVRNKNNPQIYDLVDGQQRFTTLWLLAYELGQHLQNFRRANDGLRLRFAIRDMVTDYFNHLDKTEKTDNTSTSEYKDLQRIDLARRRLQGLIQASLTNDEDKEKFAAFLLEKLKIVVTLVPQATDLNKLFDALNNRGEQLSQDEILKARLLSLIKVSTKRQRYAHLWNAISDTRNYLERALAKEAGHGYARYVADCMDKQTCNYQIKQILDLFDHKRRNTEDKGIGLVNILKKKLTEEEQAILDEYNNKEERIDMHDNVTDDELQTVRSILSFSQLLLHALRIYRYKKGLGDISRINEKELLVLFDEYFLGLLKDKEDLKAKEKICIEFLELLFEVRAAFDKYVIKWVQKDTNEEELLIKDVYKENRDYRSRIYHIRRRESSHYDGLAQLQRLLYHSQQNTTQYWLSPYLYWMQSNTPSIGEAYERLKDLDNMLFCTGRDGVLLTERTWECMKDTPNYPIDMSILEKAEGTRFPHYWFYKIDFVLWHERVTLGKQNDWGNYKFTAKNSIEHIGPQNPSDERDKVCDEYLHKIGNLALVTRSINSEYGDDAVSKKKARFTDKKSKGFLDSLKSDLIYQAEEWNDEAAEKHQNTILNILNTYFINETNGHY